MSRTRRFVHGIRLGYLTQVLTTIVGIWLTPFLLGHLGQREYGLWLTITQMLGYLGLLDLGVVAMVPRETAFAVGRGGGVDETREVAPILGRTLRIVMWQLPILALGAALLLHLLPSEWERARGVLLPILVVFVACWPLRVFNGALEGLQQFRFTGRLFLVTWVAQTATTVGLVASGMGMSSLAWGWGVSQVGAALAWFLYFRHRFPQHVPGTLPRLTRPELKEQLSRGLWTSLVQLTTALVYATDVVIIARVLGPEAAVPYVLTAKLVMVLQNQPQLFIHAAMPGLSELNAAGQGERVARAMSALSLGLLVISGGIATLVVVVNEGFVRWWVDAARFGGLSLTVVVAILMVVRHWSVTMNYCNFALGGDKKLAIVNLADAVVTVVGGVVFVHLFGIIGAPLASLVGAALVGIPFGARLLHQVMGERILIIGRAMVPYLVRMPLLLGGAVFVASRWTPDGPIELTLASIATGIVYLAVMLRVIVHSTLFDYVLGHVPDRVGRVLRDISFSMGRPSESPS